MIFALSILLLISILISLFFSINITFSRINLKQINYIEGLNNVNEGFKLGYYLNTSDYKGDKMNGTNNIEISKRLWGCYFKVSSTYKIDSNLSISKMGLIGIQNENDYCLYLADNNSKLSLTGNTLIKGNCFLPEKGVSISYIEGKSFNKKKLVEGKVKRSKSSLPPINNFIIQDNNNKLNGKFNSVDDSIISISQLISRTINNSFKNKTIVIKAGSDIVLDASWNLKGNIILHSTNSIKIRKGVKVENVILYSKNIFVEKEVEICSQLIAKNFIEIDSNSILSYPSTVITIGDSSSINFLGNSSLSGTLISYSKNSNSFNSISISTNSKVEGLVYNTNKTELKGKIYGKLITKKLFHKSPSTEYSNTLIDAEINNSNNPSFYSYAPLLKQDKSSVNIIRWLK